jgi:hypothetical protein
MTVAALVLLVVLWQAVRLRRVLPIPRKPDGSPDWQAFVKKLGSTRP